MLPPRRPWLAVLLIGCSLSTLAQTPAEIAERQLKQAAAEYDAGRFAAAATQLERLLPQAPQSFELHELLGLAYAGELKNDQALEQLQMAARLKPGSAAARTNLAIALGRAGRKQEAQRACREALTIAPHDYAANRCLAEFDLQAGRVADAQPLLEEAARARPEAYDNSYDLALADLVTGRLDAARQIAQALIAKRDAGELHNLLGKINEKQGQYLEAANEFSTAARMDPSEENLFTWASELLLHRTYEPSIDVFESATGRYPKSARLWIGLGMALYSRGEYDKSVHALLTASDLDPRDPRCYVFLSKAYLSAPSQAEDVIGRFRRYAELAPDDAPAQYYYAMSLWKGKRMDSSVTVDYTLVAELLERAIQLDPNLADAHLQLGILYNEQHDFAKAGPEYQRAIEIDQKLADAHYRLGQYYVHVGEKAKAQSEFELFAKLQHEHQAQVDKERAEVQQFVVSSKAGSSSTP